MGTILQVEGFHSQTPVLIITSPSPLMWKRTDGIQIFGQYLVIFILIIPKIGRKLHLTLKWSEW